MYYYPFSNVSRESGSLCVGANTLPIYKKPHKAHNLPAFLLSIPNNMHYYSSSNNKLGLEYRELDVYKRQGLHDIRWRGVGGG